jgi:catechol 2,3-dioxygenase-like lactoylglutathione lyase family enzyme
MIDHTGVVVSDFEKSKKFYSAALQPIGYRLLMEFPGEGPADGSAAGFGEPQKPDFWIGEAKGKPVNFSIHVAFRVNQRSLVDAFHKAALAAGGKDNGPPGIRAHYHADYYGAFVLDPDGHNIEVVCHEKP